MPALSSSITINTVNVSSSDATDTINVAILSSSNFTPGGIYLLTGHSLLWGPDASTHHIMSMFHGNAKFSGSQFSLEPPNGSTAKGSNYLWFTVWPALTSEDISLKIRTSTSTIAIGADNTTLTSLRLDEYLVENTDYFFVTSSVTSSLGTSPLSGASITFTPSAGTDWLVMTTAQLRVSSLVVNYGSLISASGTYNTTTPSASREGEDAVNTHVITLVRPFLGLAAIPQTFHEASFNLVGASGQRYYSSIFALNLSKFRNYLAEYTDTQVAMQAADWGTVFPPSTSSILTPDVSSDIYTITSAVWNPNALGLELFSRLQTNAGDTPLTQTADRKQEQEPADAIDELEWHRQWLTGSSAAFSQTYTWQGDLSGTVTNNQFIQCRSMVIFTTELAGEEVVTEFPSLLHTQFILVE